MFWHRVNEDSPLPTFLAPIKTSTTCCSVGSDAQTLSLLFWASLSDHTAEGLRVRDRNDTVQEICGPVAYFSRMGMKFFVAPITHQEYLPHEATQLSHAPRHGPRAPFHLGFCPLIQGTNFVRLRSGRP